MTEHAVVATDAAGRIEMWNEGARRLYGFTEAEVVGVRTLSDVFGTALPGDGAFADLPSDRWEGDLDAVTAAGELVTCRVVITRRGTTGGVVLVGRAATGMPTEPLPGARLVSRLGHDLRGPLGGILGLTRSLLTALAAGPVDPALLVRRIELMRSSGERLLRTVERLVDVATVEAAVTPQLASFDCRSVVGALMTPARAGSRQLRMLAELPDHPVMVIGDEDLLSRLLAELVDNAVAFTDGREVRLRVHPASAGLVQIDVSDDGPGISPPELARVLRPYERGSAAGHFGDGAGLGLHLASVLAERVGARLDATSQIDRGTTFTLRMPAARPAGPMVDRHVPPPRRQSN